jgi:hypothetical protein
MSSVAEFLGVASILEGVGVSQRVPRRRPPDREQGLPHRRRLDSDH